MAHMTMLIEHGAMTLIRSPGYQSLRTGRRSLAHQIYLITTITAQRKPHFLNADAARLAARTISAAELWFPSHCLCWVLMPDHWHGLVELGESADISTTMQRVKGVAARETKRHVDIGSPLWAKGFHDHALRREESLTAAARYIINNPVRAGLVDDPMNYPYWDTCLLGDDYRL